MSVMNPEVSFQPRTKEQSLFKVHKSKYHHVFGIGDEQLCFPTPSLRDVPSHEDFVTEMQSLSRDYVHLRFPTSVDLSLYKGRVHSIEDDKKSQADWALRKLSHEGNPTADSHFHKERVRHIEEISKMQSDLSLHHWMVEKYPTNPAIVDGVNILKAVQKSDKLSFYTLGDILNVDYIKHIIGAYSQVVNESGTNSSLHIWGGENDDQKTISELELILAQYREAGLEIFMDPYRKIDSYSKTRVLAHTEGKVLLSLSKDPQYEDALHEADAVGNQIIVSGTNATRELFYDKSVFSCKPGKYLVNENTSSTTLVKQIDRVMKSNV
jgi:hypothetical protein